MRLFARILREDHGQDLIEYSLLAAVISLTCVGLLGPIGEQINSWYTGYDVTIRTIPSGS